MKLQILSSERGFLKDTHSDLDKIKWPGLVKQNFKHSNAANLHAPCYYNIIKENFLQIGIQVDLLHFEEIDKKLPWIVDVSLNWWNYSEFDGNILDSINDDVKKELIEGCAYLVINNSWESHTRCFFEKTHQLLKNTQLPAHKVIYVCNAYKLNEHYESFANEQNIKDKILTIYSPHLFNTFNKLEFPLYDYDRTKPKIKTYLCLNRMPREHRIMMVSLLSYYDLLQYGYVSLGTTPNVRCCELDRDERLRIGFEKIKHKFPLTVDTNDFITNHVGYTSFPIEFCQQTYFSLIIGTWALEEQERSVSINEKEIKSILAKHPFITFARPYTLEYIKDMGFLTFSKWFDESYDQEVNDIKRMEKIAMEVKRLTSLNATQWQVILNEMEPILQHNYNRCVNYVSDRCYFQSDLKKFLYLVASTDKAIDRKAGSAI